MAINKNHPFDEINGVKCAVVESGISKERVEFIVPILQGNGYEVQVGEMPPPKAAKPTPPPATEAEGVADIEQEALPVLFVVGVTDVTFNVTNAIFGRLLKTSRGRVVTQAYWLQKEAVSNDEVPYYDKKNLF